MFETAIALAKTGDKEAARILLQQIVASEPNNARAWGWLAFCAETTAERRDALERVLEIDPDNHAVRRALDKLPEEKPASEKPAPAQPEPSLQAEVPSPQPSVEQVLIDATERRPEPEPQLLAAEPALEEELAAKGQPLPDQPPADEVYVLPPQPDQLGHLGRFWVWATASRRKAVVVFALIALLACCCPVGAVILLIPGGEPAPTPTSVVAQVFPTPITTSTPAATDTAEPTDTPEPTHTPQPTATPEPTDTPAPSPTPEPQMIEAQVTEIVDGDTIKVMIDGTEYTVRYIGIDTPETKSPSEPLQWMGPEATEANRALVEGQTVLLDKDASETDRYNRLLRYVYVGDTFVNYELVRLGFAEAKAYPPDTKHQTLLAAVEEEARDAGRGLWTQAAPVPLACLDSAYVADLTVPDNTRFQPHETFVKTWRVRNTGDCAWPPDTQLNVVDDADLISPGSSHVGPLEPGETADVSIEMQPHQPSAASEKPGVSHPAPIVTSAPA